MQNQGIRVVASFVAKPESVAEVKRILTDMIGLTRAEAGCITYELLQNADDPTDFTFVEEWSSRADLDRHSEADHIETGRQLVRDHIAEPTDVRVYTLVK